MSKIDDLIKKAIARVGLNTQLFKRFCALSRWAIHLQIK